MLEKRITALQSRKIVERTRGPQLSLQSPHLHASISSAIASPFSMEIHENRYRIDRVRKFHEPSVNVVSRLEQA